MAPDCRKLSMLQRREEKPTDLNHSSEQRKHRHQNLRVKTRGESCTQIGLGGFLLSLQLTSDQYIHMRKLPILEKRQAEPNLESHWFRNNLCSSKKEGKTSYICPYICPYMPLYIYKGIEQHLQQVIASVVLSLIFKSLIHFEFIFVYDIRRWSRVLFWGFFACIYPIFPTPFIKQTIIASLYVFASFVTY